MFYVTPRKLPRIVANYFFWLGTATLGVLPTVAPVCIGASGMGTSLKSSWPIALMVYVSVACNQSSGRLYNPMQILRTDCTDKAKEDQSSSDVLNEVRLTGAVESSGRLVLLVVVRRLGHAAGRISF